MEASARRERQVGLSLLVTRNAGGHVVTNDVIDVLAAFALRQADAHQVMRAVMLHGDWL